MVFVVEKSVSRSIYLVNYQLVIYMLMKKVFIGVESDGQLECRISFLAKILAQDSVILLCNFVSFPTLYGVLVL